MKHFASSAFWSDYHALPKEVRALADKNWHTLAADEGEEEGH